MFYFSYKKFLKIFHKLMPLGGHGYLFIMALVFFFFNIFLTFLLGDYN